MKSWPSDVLGHESLCLWRSDCRMKGKNDISTILIYKKKEKIHQSLVVIYPNGIYIFTFLFFRSFFAVLFSRHASNYNTSPLIQEINRKILNWSFWYRTLNNAPLASASSPSLPHWLARWAAFEPPCDRSPKAKGESARNYIASPAAHFMALYSNWKPVLCALWDLKVFQVSSSRLVVLFPKLIRGTRTLPVSAFRTECGRGGWEVSCWARAPGHWG